VCTACWTLAFVAVVCLTAPTIGTFARTNFITKVNNVFYSESSGWFKNWENRGLIAWMDKNDNDIIQHRSEAVFEEKTPKWQENTAGEPVVGAHGQR